MKTNFILVTLDCVRADHLGCYGYGGVETPYLDRMAASGVLFEQAVTHAPNTWVAHASLFTGCFPPVHGLRAPHHSISPQVITMAEWFASHGWATAAFPGTTLVGKVQGFQRGFDFFDQEWEAEGFHAEQVVWRKDWKKALCRALDWMEKAGEPFLLWIHYMDTHHLPELQLPQYYRSRFSQRWQFYDGKISYADKACMGELWEYLRYRGLLERTVLVVFADHGEELHEDDRPVHDGGLGEDVVRVPLIFKLPDSMKLAGLRVKEQVGLVDIFPTCCRLANISVPDAIQGIAWGFPTNFHGGQVQPRELYMENWYKGFVGLRTKEWKLIMKYQDLSKWGSDSPEITALYHLPSDPREQKNLAKSHALVVNELKKACHRWAFNGNIHVISQQEHGKIQRALESLGYM